MSQTLPSLGEMCYIVYVNKCSYYSTANSEKGGQNGRSITGGKDAFTVLSAS